MLQNYYLDRQLEDKKWNMFLPLRVFYKLILNRLQFNQTEIFGNWPHFHTSCSLNGKFIERNKTTISTYVCVSVCGCV